MLFCVDSTTLVLIFSLPLLPPIHIFYISFNFHSIPTTISVCLVQLCCSSNSAICASFPEWSFSHYGTKCSSFSIHGMFFILSVSFLICKLLNAALSLVTSFYSLLVASSFYNYTFYYVFHQGNNPQRTENSTARSYKCSLISRYLFLDSYCTYKFVVDENTGSPDTY